MKTMKLALITAATSLLAGCITHTSISGLEPISPKPHSISFSTPTAVDSLRPTFTWKTTEPDQKVDIGIWELDIVSGGGQKYQEKGQRIYYKKAIAGGRHQLEADLLPDKLYCWSIKPTGTTNWSRMTHVVSAPAANVAYDETKRDFFIIKTPKQ
jgi:hypothetical protein